MNKPHFLAKNTKFFYEFTNKTIEVSAGELGESESNAMQKFNIFVGSLSMIGINHPNDEIIFTSVL
jgi:hypothetical protein